MKLACTATMAIYYHAPGRGMCKGCMLYDQKAYYTNVTVMINVLGAHLCKEIHCTITDKSILS